MGSFKRALLGYRRDDVDAAISACDEQVGALERLAGNAAEQAREAAASAAQVEAELASLSGMVIEREREIRSLSERLRDANERHEHSIASLHAVSERLEEIQTQARGQATRIRMKALREAVEVSRRTQELSEVHEASANGESAGPAGAEQPGPNGVEQPGPNGVEAALGELFEGLIKLEIGPLGDFSQLVGFENAVGRLGASEISVERFSEGRATLSMRLDEPVDLLRELEENAPFDFNIRRTADERLVLDVDEDENPEQRAA
jgi:hypothetical protein